MRSRRLPPLHEPNLWTRALEARRAAAGEPIDLTEGNPTRVGLSDPADLAALADPRAAEYRPDPLGMGAARAAVAAYYLGRGVALTADRIVLTAGTSEAYAHLFRLLADPGDAVLVPTPGYPLFEPIAALEGVRTLPYRLAWDGAWHLDRASLERGLAAGPRAVVVVQPHVPTGSWLGEGDAAHLEAACAAGGAAVVADEVFADHAWPDATAEAPGFAGRDGALTFALGGISKLCGLPQVKLSWIAVSGPERPRREALAGLEWISDLFLSVGTPVQLALPALLARRRAFAARVRERIGINLERLAETERRVPSVRRAGGGGGWSAVLRMPARRSGEAWALALMARGVAAHPGEFYDLEGGAFLVVSLIPEPARFDAGLERIERLVAED